MRIVALLVLAVLVSGCSADPGAAPPTAEEVSLAYAPQPDPTEEAPPETDEGRQSRPATASEPAPRRDNITPARWDGETDAYVGCLPHLCVIRASASDARRVAAGPDVWTVRVTITWDAVDEATEQLQVFAGGTNATGPSPLVLQARTHGQDDVRIRVQALHDDVAVNVPSQPFRALAEFNA